MKTCIHSLIGISLLIAASGCGLSIENANVGAPPGTGFITKSVTVDGDVRNYSVFIPHAYTPNKKWPVIVFLHGVLEAGNNGTSCLSVGLGAHIAKDPKNFNFIAVFPHSPGDWSGPDRGRIVIACLDEVQKKYATDTDCVTLTGLSNGGTGTWTVAGRYPNRFSSIAPMCGASDVDMIPRLTRIPVWCFHNSGDFLITSSNSREMCQKLTQSGGNVKYKQFEVLGHNCWDEAYAYQNGELFRWMLAQPRAASSAISSSPSSGASRN